MRQFAALRESDIKSEALDLALMESLAAVAAHS
jgi:hypothetical protein